MTIEDIKITLSNGRKYKLKQPDTLQEIDSKREALFLFDNMRVFEGWSDGEVDDDGDFCIFKTGKNFGLGLPFGRLLGWAYKRQC